MEYYYAEGDVQKGPFALADLARQGLKPGTLVWRDGMPQWQRADAVPELQSLFAAPVAAAAQPAYPMGAEARIDALPGTEEVPLAPAPAAPTPTYATGVTQPYYAQQPYPAAQQPAPAAGYTAYPAAAAGYSAGYAGQQLGYAGYATEPVQPPSGLAIASMILGIVAVPTSCMYGIGVPCAILAVIFGHIARGKARRRESGGAGMALAGLICGYIMLAMVVVGIIFLAIAIASAGAGSKGRGW
jgi:hypothetical protein